MRTLRPTSPLLAPVHHLSGQEGFTLIELLVVIIIIGILAAIALPSFLNQAAKAKQSEAKSYVGAVMRAQQAYRISNSTFANAITRLELGIPTQTTDYTYRLPAANATSTRFEATATDGAILKSYATGIIVRDGLTAGAACQTVTPSSTPPSIQLNVNNPISPQCQGNGEPMR